MRKWPLYYHYVAWFILFRLTIYLSNFNWSSSCMLSCFFLMKSCMFSSSTKSERGIVKLMQKKVWFREIYSLLIYHCYTYCIISFGSAKYSIGLALLWDCLIDLLVNDPRCHKSCGLTNYQLSFFLIKYV